MMPDELMDEFSEVLKDLVDYHMPFGKFGPDNFPPKGVPVYDLPYEYLAYFKKKGGFPAGKLGRLMEFVYYAKLDGADAMFDPIRKLKGGRTLLREKKGGKSYDFTNGATDAVEQE